MGATILIVDDNAQLRALMREIVAEESDLHVVGEAADGAEAMRLVQALRPAIVLLDLVMPAGQRPGGPAVDQGGAPRDQSHYRDRARRRRLSPGGGGQRRRCLSPQEDPCNRPAADNPAPVRLYVTAACIAHRRAVRHRGPAGRNGRLI